MADNIEFVNGLIVKAPHQNAPGFVKSSISIKVADLKAWLDTRDEEWVNIDVKESRAGKWFAAVSTYKPKGAEEKPQSKQQENKRNAQGGSRSLGDMDDDIPFAPINKRIV